MTKSTKRKLWLLLALAILSAAIALPSIGLVEFALHRHSITGIAPLPAYIQTRTIQASDGVSLKASLFRAQQDAGRCLILLHGVAANRRHMLNMASTYSRLGYTTLAPDSRAHGESGGQYVTYGLLERADLSRWVDAIQSESCSSGVYAIGVSMGAAVLLQALPGEPRIRAAAAESPFFSFHRIGQERVTQILPALNALRTPIVSVGFNYARLRYGLDLESASPELAAPHTQTPVLFIHCEKDTNIVPSHSRDLLPLYAHARLITIPNGTHAACFGANQSLYTQATTDWFATH